MTVPTSGLNGRCGSCDRRVGDHTLDEWASCLGTPTTDVAFEPVDDSDPAMVAFITDQLRERFALDPQTIVADHVTVYASTLEGGIGTFGVRVPALIHDFAMGIAGRPPATVAKVVYVGSPEGMLSYGRLVRESTGAAVRAAEGRRRR